jgi:hypothetical protein
LNLLIVFFSLYVLRFIFRTCLLGLGWRAFLVSLFVGGPRRWWTSSLMNFGFARATRPGPAAN